MNKELEQKFAHWCEEQYPYYAEEYLDTDSLNPEALKELADSYTTDKTLRKDLYEIINIWIYDILSDITYATDYDKYLK